MFSLLSRRWILSPYCKVQLQLLEGTKLISQIMYVDVVSIESL